VSSFSLPLQALIFSPGGNRHSKLEKTHKSGQSNARNLCTEKKPRAQEAPIYGPFELSLYAEETILNPDDRRNVNESFDSVSAVSVTVKSGRQCIVFFLCILLLSGIILPTSGMQESIL